MRKGEILDRVIENTADALRIDEMQIYAIMYINAQCVFSMQLKPAGPSPPRESEMLAKPNASQPLS